MSATYNVVSIGGTEYEVLADLATANAYLAAEPSADLWREADEDANSRALVSATRILNRQPWTGEKTDPDQALAFPRDGDEAIPQDIVDACCELANAIRNGYDAANLASTASNLKRQKAGSVEQEFFAPGIDEGTRLPLPVMELIGPYLGSAGEGIAGGYASGTCGTDAFADDYGIGRPV